MSKNISEIFKERVGGLISFYREKGRMPTFSEMSEIFNLRSKNAVFKFVKKLELSGLVSKDDKGRLIPKSIGKPLRLLGTVEAGFPSPAEEQLLDTVSLDDFLISNKNSSFMLKVSGNSMIDAGIMPNDLVIVDKSILPKNGDIVIAEVDGEWTMKYFKKRGVKITLVPANPNYPEITPKKELKIGGVVVSVIRKLKN